MKKIAIIGAGNMGYAILRGITGGGIFSPSAITVADKSEACRQRAANEGVAVTSESGEAVKDAKLIILAVKPNMFDAVAAEIGANISADAVIVSILAGKTLKTIESAFGEDAKLIRVMPNTPALVGCGMSGICLNASVSDEEIAEVGKIFGSFGVARIVDEDMMDTVTGISGSGPAYAFMFIDGLMKAGVKNGMSESDAKLFAAQTVLGAAQMVLKNDISPEQLKINVCSPGGTTIEAVKVFEENDLYGIIEKAVDACIAKSKKMSIG